MSGYIDVLKVLSKVFNFNIIKELIIMNKHDLMNLLYMFTKIPNKQVIDKLISMVNDITDLESDILKAQWGIKELRKEIFLIAERSLDTSVEIKN